MPRQLYVFGSNGEGQLGIPAADIVNVPSKVRDAPPLEDIVAVRGGDNHTLFHYRDGSVYGVGDNRKGQLSSLGEASQIPVFKKAYHGASLIAASCESSAHITRAESAQSSVHSEGTGQWGELGRGEEVSRGALSSINAPLPGKVINFAAGVWHYVAILEDGTVYGWGKARLGQLGNNLTGKITTPTKIDNIPLTPIQAVCGKDFTYLVGDPSSGEHMLLGKDKFNIISNMPKTIKRWKQVGATWHAIFVLFADGTLTAWGKENMWKLLPPNLPLLDKMAVGSDHVLALTTHGKLISWGWGKHGNCGDLTNVKHHFKNDMLSDFWNDIHIPPGPIETIGAGFCTSFVVVR